ncbi:MAG: hypothetical protein KBH23_07670 [Bacteroidaceae bacterium]|nr:hypothetical protein [Bacteroidaceae bacterium]MBP9637450.1 hypothetical protein [Bacteroidaceae bacterium]
MNKTIKVAYPITILLLVNVLLTLMGFYVFQKWPTPNFLSWMIPLPVVFTAWGYTFIYRLKSALQNSEKQLVTIYLLLRVLKILFLLGIAVIYIFLLPDQMLAWIGSFAAFYLVYLVWEMRVFFWFEKSRKALEEIRKAMETKQEKTEKDEQDTNLSTPSTSSPASI